jgi:hypothetical protein
VPKNASAARNLFSPIAGTGHRCLTRSVCCVCVCGGGGGAGSTNNIDAEAAALPAPSPSPAKAGIAARVALTPIN